MPAISICQRLVLFACVISFAAIAEPVYIPTPEELAEGQIEIVTGDDRTIYEYRVGGRLLAIKVVPERGRPYYMVPADGEAHYESLDHKKRLYPQWVIVEF